MAVIEESVHISRPPQEVFDVLIKTSNIPVWDSSVIQAEQLGDGPVQVGPRFKGTSKIMGRRFDWVTENIQFEPPSKTVIRSVEGPMTFTISYSLEPQGADGTRLTYSIDADATREEIEALVAQSQKRSAVFDIITNPTNVTVEVS